MNKALLALILFSIFLLSGCIQLGDKASEEQVYAPEINPEEFTATIDNPFFTLVPGTTFTYESETDEGVERIVVEVTEVTKLVAIGVETRIVRDRVYLDNVLVEDTRDWYAQDSDGNVWYFGEDVDNYENGVLKDHHGAWEAGVDGGQPGIIMPANPQVGDKYRQEYYAGEAEDEGEIISVDETVSVPYGDFTGCLQTRDFTKLDPGVEAMKFYCAEVGFTVLELEGDARVELIDVTKEA
jgi:hypothetical protein